MLGNSKTQSEIALLKTKWEVKGLSLQLELTLSSSILKRKRDAMTLISPFSNSFIGDIFKKEKHSGSSLYNLSSDMHLEQ